MKRRDAAFTLLEIMLALGIVLLITLAAMPVMDGLFGDERLQKSFEDFDAFVKQAQTRAIKERKTMLLVWDKNEIALEPEAPSAEDAEAAATVLPFPNQGTITLERPAALIKDAPAEWAFWKSGACEPVRVHYESADGNWIADYEPLTARGSMISSTAK